MSGHRQERIEQLIAQIVGSMIVMGEIKDHRVSTLVSIGEVSVAKDLYSATVSISGYLDDKELGLAADGLNSAAGFIQSRLAKHLKTRLTPRLRFIVNRNMKAAFELIKKIDELEISEPDAADDDSVGNGTPE